MSDTDDANGREQRAETEKFLERARRAQDEEPTEFDETTTDTGRQRPRPRGHQVPKELLSSAVQKYQPARRRQAKRRQEQGIELPGARQGSPDRQQKRQS